MCVSSLLPVEMDGHHQYPLRKMVFFALFSLFTKEVKMEKGFEELDVPVGIYTVD